MAPVSRKRKSPEPSASSALSSSEDEHLEKNTSTFTTQLQYKCPEDGCRKTFKDDNATVIMPTLPHFDTIYQTTTGHYICPFSECDKQHQGISELKQHYRVHCSSDYRPFRCKFSASCRFAAVNKSVVKRHIQLKHISSDNTDLDASDFVETRTDWLEMEDDLFTSAKIVSAPDIQTPRPFACTFANCSKICTKIANFRNHLRIHTQSKPFKCSYSSCEYTANVKSHLLQHIYSLHFKISRKKFRNLSKEDRQKAEQYVVVDQEMLDIEEAQIADSRIGPKRRKRNHHVDDDNKIPYYLNVEFEDTTTDDEDDKDELALLLATVQPTFLN